MSLIKRYIDIDFGVDARPLKRVPGTIVQGNNKVNVLRITYPNINSDHVVVALTQRADQVTGSTFLDYSANSGSFELVLHNWFTAVSGDLQITFAIYSQTPEINEEGIITTETDTLRKVYLNVEESISADLPAPEDESIFLDVAVMVKSYDDRITALELQFITDLSALDNFTNPGIYKFNFDDKYVFHLFVIQKSDTLIEQVRSGRNGYYTRTIFNGVANEWQYTNYNVNGITEWNESITYKKGAIVSCFENLFVCREPNKNIIPYTDETYWNHITFDSYVVREDLNNYVPKEEGKGLSSNDYTNEEKNKLAGLENYDDTSIKNQITFKEDKSNLKALAYKDSLNKTDVGLGNVRNVESYSKTETDEKISDVIEIAEGKTNSYVLKYFNNPSFESNEDVIQINLKDNPILDSSGETISNTALKIGDIFYIIETNVPDRWLGGIDRDVYTFFKMESKPDLSNYLEKNNLKTINGENIVGSGNIEVKGADVDLSNYYNKTETDALLPKTIDLGEIVADQPYPFPTDMTFESFVEIDAVKLITTIQEMSVNCTLKKTGEVQSAGMIFSTIVINMLLQFMVTPDGMTLLMTETPSNWWVKGITNNSDKIEIDEYAGSQQYTQYIYGNKIKLNETTYYPFSAQETSHNTIDIDAVIKPIKDDVLNKQDSLFKVVKIQDISLGVTTIKEIVDNLISLGIGIPSHDAPRLKLILGYDDYVFENTYITLKTYTSDTDFSVTWKSLWISDGVFLKTVNNVFHCTDTLNDVILSISKIMSEKEPDESTMILRKSFSFYTSNYVEGLTLQEENTGIFGGGSTVYLRNNDVSINSKSFNKLYEDVQLLKGSYDLLRPSNGMAYTYEVDSNMAKYAMISQVGGMSYKSNNLLVLDDVSSTTLNGITYSVKEGIIKLSGTSTSSVFITLPIKSINLDGSYARNGFNNFANTTYDDIYLRFRNDSAGAFESNFLYFNTPNKTSTMTYDNVTYDQLAINIKSGITCSNYIIKPMLVSGSTAPISWELGFEGIRHTKVTNIIHRSSNLIQLDDVSSTTKNGITYKVKDGVITLNGTTTSAFGINLPLVNTIPAGTYTLNRFGDKGTDGSTFGICYSNGWEMGVQIAFNNDTTYKTATITSEGTYLRLYLNSNGTYSNYTLKPMLVSGSNAPANYSPYADYANISLNNLYEMEGYGLGINNTFYNYLDFDKDVLVDRVVYEKLDSTATVTVSSSVAVRLNVDAPVITDTTNFISNYNIIFINGSYAYIPLTEFTGTTADAIKAELGTKPLELVHLRKVEVERSLPQIDTFIDVSKGGVIIFENEHQQAVPYEIKYIRPED